MTPAVLLLAAGRSTRLGESAAGRPKPLMEVAGESILGWNLRWLRQSGIAEAWVNLHYEAEQIRAAVGNGDRYGVRVRYSEEPELLGTAGAWLKLARREAGPWLIVYGDNLTRFDLQRMLAAWHPGTALVALFDRQAHRNTGIAGGTVEVAGGNIRAFHEGSPDGGQLVNAGVYVIDAALAARGPAGFADFGRDIFPGLAAAGVLRAHLLEADAVCLGLDTPRHFEIGAALVQSGEVAL